MKFSEKWLRTAIDPELSSAQLEHVLTMAGLEVEVREPVAPMFEGVVVARIAAVTRHPQSDRLKICEIHTGSETLQVVCGAANACTGILVACAKAGARLPGMHIEPVQVRGVDSQAVLCSERELGLGEDHGGLMVLGDDACVGADLRAALELDDWIFTLKLTPNRGDCLSIEGLARELAALIEKPYEPQRVASVAAVIPERRSVHLEAGPACPRYCGRVVANVNARAATPQWMVRRLRRSGLRPISALVDITNYVMLETGQPLHAFDLARLQGNVHVRYAADRERLKLLDGRDIDLARRHLVIADDGGPIALAGVMGGAASAVNEQTATVFLESAFFAPEAVAAASRGLDIPSDAAHRFERGVDFNLAPRAIERATALMIEICGGEPGPVVEALGTLPSRAAIAFEPGRIRSTIGIDIPSDQIGAILRRLSIEVAHEGERWHATPPSFRFDLSIEADLIEEVARVHGYEAIPPTLPVASAPILHESESRMSTERLKRALAARGYFETITFSFIDRELETDFGVEANPVGLTNPLASQMSVMRSSLLGSLVQCVRFNVSHKQERVRLFEVAACYRWSDGAYEQVERVAGVCYGTGLQEQWGERARPVDFFDVRGDLEAIFGGDALEFVAAVHASLHPGQSARVLHRGRSAGWLGALHPRLMRKYELDAPTIVFELDRDLVRELPLVAHRPVSRFPAVRRDLALVVARSTEVAALARSIRTHGAPLVTEVNLFDVYQGKGIPEGRKSLAFRVLLQDTEKTLTDAEVEAVIQRIVMILQQEHGATLRT